jgi:hypothetical protein
MPVEPMEATAVLLLLQVPPGTGLPKVVTAPMQTDVTPEIASGKGLTVTTVVA